MPVLTRAHTAADVLAAFLASTGDGRYIPNSGHRAATGGVTQLYLCQVCSWRGKCWRPGRPGQRMIRSAGDARERFADRISRGRPDEARDLAAVLQEYKRRPQLHSERAS